MPKGIGYGRVWPGKCLSTLVMSPKVVILVSLLLGQVKIIYHCAAQNTLPVAVVLREKDTTLGKVVL